MKLRVKAGHRYDQGLRRYLPGEEVDVEERFVRILTSETCPLEHIPAVAPPKTAAVPVVEAKKPPVAAKPPRYGRKDITPAEPPATAAPVTQSTPEVFQSPAAPPVEPAAAPEAPPPVEPQPDMLCDSYGRRDMRATDG